MCPLAGSWGSSPAARSTRAPTAVQSLQGRGDITDTTGVLLQHQVPIDLTGGHGTGTTTGAAVKTLLTSQLLAALLNLKPGGSCALSLASITWALTSLSQYRVACSAGTPLLSAR